MSITTKKMISCFSELFKTKTIPKTNWFWIAYSIFVTVLFHFKSINSTDPNTQTNFLSNYLPHNIVTKTSEGLFFVARPKFEDLARFLFSKHLSKWEPLSLIHPKNDQIIVDVGSNVGYYALKLSPFVGSTGKIVAFEADPETCKILNENCKLNNFQNIEVKNSAVSDSQGHVTLFQAFSHSGQNSIVNTFSKSNSIQIPATTLDHELKNYTQIDWIKIDVEGAELSVLRGAMQTLKITNKILIEVHEKILEKNNQNVDEILSILKSNGFTITLFPEFWNKNNSQNQTLKSDYILGEKSC